jgi:hypothetical protein
MQLSGGILTIGLELTIEEIRELEQFLRAHLEEIKKIEVEEGGALHSSALIALLVSLKHTRPEVEIPFLEQRGAISPLYGTLHWVCHD